MAKAQDFKVRFDFTSTKADGDGYSRTITIKAHNAQNALALAKHEGWKYWGARFTENCYDWNIVRE